MNVIKSPNSLDEQRWNYDTQSVCSSQLSYDISYKAGCVTIINLTNGFY